MILPALTVLIAMLAQAPAGLPPAPAPTGLPPAPTWRSDGPATPPPSSTWRKDAPVTPPSELSGSSVPRSPDGHFYVTGLVNGIAVRFVVDTGASAVVLTPQDAARVGFNLPQNKFTMRGRSANGYVQVAPVRLQQVAIGGREMRNVAAAVSSVDTGISLLGMTYLGRLRRVSIEGDRLTME